MRLPCACHGSISLGEGRVLGAGWKVDGFVRQINPLSDCEKSIGHKGQSHLPFLVFLYQGTVRTEI